MLTTSFNPRCILKINNLVNRLLPCYYFSAERDNYVNKARALEKLKAIDSFSQTFYENGRYIIFLKSDMVCLEKGEKLAIRDYKEKEPVIKNFRHTVDNGGVIFRNPRVFRNLGKENCSNAQDINKYGNSTTVLLDILSELESEVYLFAMDLDVEVQTDIEKIEIVVDGKFENVRRSLYFLDQKESQYVTHARGLFNFCKTCNFCCYCGGKLSIKEGGHQKQCSNCEYNHYPTLAPIGLTLIEDEKHKEVLLVRQQRHPPGMYTCVAGFIEPGESLEDSVKREVAEETGLNISTVEYCTSQHWALPTCQLTLGCIATTRNKAVDIDPKEILDAKWVTSEELKDAVLRVRNIKNLSEMNEKKLWAPPRNAVSHFLMVAWLQKYHGFDLESS